MPIVQDMQELSYRVKCVDVESERVFGDVVVTRRTSAAEVNVYRKKRQNLFRQTLDAPDFLELNRVNRKFSPKRRNTTIVQTSAYDEFDERMNAFKTTRSKSFDYYNGMMTNDDCFIDKVDKNSVRSTGERRKKVIIFIGQTLKNKFLN